MPSPFWKRIGRDLVRPIGNGFAKVGITANAVTIAGLLLAAGSGYLLAADRWILAFVSLLASGLCDLLDGAVARAKGGEGTRFGAALDSTVDRYGEALVLAGLLIDGVRHGQGDGFIWLWALALTASFLTSYVRARAEGLGLSCEVGLMERPERLALLALACLIGSRSVPVVLGVLALGGHITFLQRLHLVWRASRDEGAGS